MNTQTLCIIQTGAVNPILRDKYPSYGKMFTTWLSNYLPQWSFAIASIVEGDALPKNPTDYQAYLITGSRHSVNDDIAWIPQLEEFIVNVQKERIPMIGICFGHQIIAKANKGKVEKSDKGWGLGTHNYQLHDDVPQSLPKTISHYAYHQDQVTEQPANSKCLGSNAHCSTAILTYDFPNLTFQFHPEFTKPYVRDLIDLNAGKKFSQEFADTAKSQLDDNNHNQYIGKWIAHFLDTHSV